MNDHAIKQLGASVALQAVKDFVDGTPKQRTQILKDLRSSWMETITDGTSLVVAEQLEKHPEEIRARIHKHESEE